MKVSYFPNAQAFSKDVGAFLQNDVHLNNLMLGLLSRLSIEAYSPNDVFVSVEDGRERLVAMMSGLYLILYANSERDALYETLIRSLDEKAIDYPGIIGPVAHCEAFKNVYETLYSKTLTCGMRQRIFVIEKTAENPALKGYLMQATKAHEATVIPWLSGFFEDIGESEHVTTVSEKFQQLVDKKTLYLLKEQGRLVSMAACIRPFMRGISVGYVYTPDHARRQGYATSCVTQLTEKLLEKYDYVTLYTDLANPTSNSIYQKIGYRPIGDSVVYIKA